MKTESPESPHAPHLSLEELISPPDGSIVGRHLDSCPSCRSEMRQWRHVGHAVQSIVARSDPPAELVAEVLSAVGGPRRARRGRVPAGRLRVAVLAGSCAVVLALALVLTVLAAPRQGPTRAPAATHPPATQPAGGASTGKWQLVGDTTAPWRSIPAPTNLGGLPRYTLVCPSESDCYMLGWLDGSMTVGQVDATHDGGSSWQTFALPTQLGGGASLSCTSAGTCAVLGLDPAGHLVFLESSDGARTWTSETGPAGYGARSYVGSLACVSPRQCTAVVAQATGSLIVVGGPATTVTTTDGGATWSQEAVPTSFSPALSGLQCAATGACVIVGSESTGGGGAAIFRAGAGEPWQMASVPAGSDPLSLVACAGAGDCLATSAGGPGELYTTGSTVVRSGDGGRSWTAVAATGLPRGLGADISCPSISYCWSSGVSFPPGSAGAIQIDQLHGVLALSTDGGRTWQDAQLPAGVYAVQSVSCPSTNVCYAFAILQSADGQPHFGILSDRSG